MDTKMRYIRAVNSEHSFTKAAKKLHISQPSLSIMVKKVETELGGPIFDRGTPLLDLTDIGQAYMKYSDAIEENEEEFRRRLIDIHRLYQGNIRLGGSNRIISGFLPLILQRLIPEYPGITFEITEGDSAALQEQMADGGLDVVIDNFDQESEDMRYEFLIDETILLAVPENFLEDGPDLREWQVGISQIRSGSTRYPVLPTEYLDRLLRRRFILLKPSNDSYFRAQYLFRSHGITPNVLTELDQMTTSYRYASRGLGSCFTTDTLFRYTDLSPDGMALFATGDPYLTRRLSIAYRKERYISSATRLFIQTAQAFFRSEKTRAEEYERKHQSEL